MSMNYEELIAASQVLGEEALQKSRDFMERWLEERKADPRPNLGDVRTCDCGHEFWSVGGIMECPVCIHQYKVIRDCLDG